MDKPSSRPDSFSRRGFLRLAGAFGCGLACQPLGPAREEVRHDGRLIRLRETRLKMGTFVSLTLLHPHKQQAEEGIEAAFQEIERLTGLLSRFSSLSPLAELNRAGKLADAPPELQQVIVGAQKFFQLSRGAFDISVLPLVELFQQRFATGAALPGEAAVQDALALVDARAVRLGPGRQIRLDRPGMALTLDGIAKGYIVDRASAVLSACGIKNHLINAGGDIKVSGQADGRPWTVAIQDPEKKGARPAVLRLRQGAIATSGNYEVYYDQQKLYHHIIDPSSGRSPRISTSVSVTASTAMAADALSTTVFVMGPQRGVQLIDSLPGSECLVLARSGSKCLSRGWPRATL